MNATYERAGLKAPYMLVTMAMVVTTNPIVSDIRTVRRNFTDFQQIKIPER